LKGVSINGIVSCGITYVPEGKKLFPYLGAISKIRLDAYRL
jgi:hypothetical protein